MTKKQIRKLKRIYRCLRRPFEWLAIGIGILIIPPLTLRGLQRLANFMADVGYLFDKRGREVAAANLRIMYGKELSRRRIELITRRSYRNMTRVLLNIFWLTFNTRKRVLNQVTFAPGVFETLKKHHPAITLSGHIGNWEVLSQAVIAHDVPIMSVAKKIGTKGMTACLTRVRARIGQQIVPAAGALRPLIGALRNNTSIGLIADQHVSTCQGGGWITFFGLPASMSLTPAMLSRKLERPILLAWSRPLKDGHYRIELGKAFMPDPSVDDLARTQQIATTFEHIIRRHPSLWCLNYRRWRCIPAHAPATHKYPNYARPEKIRISACSPKLA